MQAWTWAQSLLPFLRFAAMAGARRSRASRVRRARRPDWCRGERTRRFQAVARPQARSRPGQTF
eukprot:scaffold647_cov411-Prasinococcus_capsulatus_cf.AAC.11